MSECVTARCRCQNTTTELTSRAAHCLAKRVHPRPHAVLQPQVADQAAAALAEPARRVRLVDDDAAVAARQPGVDAVGNVPERRQVAVHAVHALDGDEDAGRAAPEPGALVAPRQRRQDLVEAPAAGPGARRRRRAGPAPHAVVRKRQRPRPAEPHAVVHARVDQLVVDDGVAGLRRAAEEPRVGLEARVEEEAGGRAVEGRDRLLERLGGGGVAVEQPRAPGAEREAVARGPLQAGEVGGPDVRVRREGEVAVGREVDEAGRRQGEAAQAALCGAAGEQRRVHVVQTVCLVCHGADGADWGRRGRLQVSASVLTGNLGRFWICIGCRTDSMPWSAAADGGGGSCRG